MKNKIKNIIILTLFVISSIVTIYVVTNKENGLELLVVFGKEINITKGKSVYEINMKSAELNLSNNGCQKPVQVIYNKKEDYDGVSYLVAGEKEAYFKFDFNDEEDKTGNIDTYDLYVHVYLEEPLVMDCEREE